MFEHNAGNGVYDRSDLLLGKAGIYGQRQTAAIRILGMREFRGPVMVLLAVIGVSVQGDKVNRSADAGLFQLFDKIIAAEIGRVRPKADYEQVPGMGRILRSLRR